MDQNNTDLHDASFSYLRAGEGLELNHNNNLSGSVQVQQYPPPPLMSLGRITKTTDQEGEISVFGAERYFNMILHDDINKSSKIGGYKKEINNNSNNKVDHHHHPQKITRTKSKPGTPSSCSEVSWNSQKALLPTLIRNPSLNKKKKLINGKKFFATTFSCGGSCYDKKSIYVHEEEEVRRKDDHQHQLVQIDHVIPLKPQQQQQQQQQQPQQQQQQQQQQQRLINVKQKNQEDQHFAFPILNPGGGVQVTSSTTSDEKLVLQLEKKKKTAIEDEEEEIPRRSLEVFGSNTMKGDVVAINLERKLSMLTWDAIPKVSNVSTASGTTTTRINDDMESDASSDLFEIENISCSTGFQPLFTRQVSDGMSSCMTPNSRYEPSEASIDWSVVTSSAAGGGHDVSVVRDYDEKKLEANSRPSTNSIAKTKAGMENKEVQRNRHSGILGCKSHKSVRVAESVYRTKG